MKNIKFGILIRLYTLCAGLCTVFCGATASEQYNFRQITPRDGMLSNVRCVHVEKQGFDHTLPFSRQGRKASASWGSAP